MQVYLVGGAVRDELLGLPVGERDWVVVGATRERLLAEGYKEVGREFPVFLHPQTHEEYALARRERKVAPGYRGFTVEFGPEVTLQEDLLRRDLTINAMARAADGMLIDPYDGQGDLRRRELRHVSDAFVEDPVRVLRIARFAARFAPLGFRVARDTQDLLQRMSAGGELDSLVPERVWQETERALAAPAASEFFKVLRACGALRVVFPEIDALFGVPQPAKWHPEIDTGVHTLMVLDQAVVLTGSVAIRFAALVHDLGKADTPPQAWPAHRGHEQRSMQRIRELCARLKVPAAYRDLALLVAQYHGLVHRAFELRPATLLEMFEGADAFRRPARFSDALCACEADARGRLGLEACEYPQRPWLLAALDAASVKLPAAEMAALDGASIAARIRQMRLAAIQEYMRRARERAAPRI